MKEPIAVLGSVLVIFFSESSVPVALSFKTFFIVTGVVVVGFSVKAVVGALMPPP